MAILAAMAKGQMLQDLTGGIFGENSVITGVKNILGGVVGADGVHKKCMQKYICEVITKKQGLNLN